MLEEAIKAIKDSSLQSSVYVGCDSIRFKKHGQWHAKYATVVIVHKDSNKGASVFYDIDVLPDYGGLKMRLLNEVMFATNVAIEVMEHLDGRHMEIHLDINNDPKHKSNVAKGEAIGYVLGNTGIEPRIKPHSFAAMHAADHIVNGKNRPPLEAVA